MTATRDAQLRECPFCDGAFPAVPSQDRAGHMVICTGCSALGPTRTTQAEAIAAWNKRACLPAPDTAREVVAWTGSGSIIALQDGREGFIWPTRADAHPIPLYAAPQAPATGEREAIVAWLRERQEIFRSKYAVSVDPAVKAIADAIERGEHLASLSGGAEGGERT